MRFRFIFPLGLILAALFIYCIFRGPSCKKYEDCESTDRQKHFKIWESRYKRCLIDKLKSEPIQWAQFGKIIESCNASYARDLLRVQSIRNKDDIKWVIMPLGSNYPYPQSLAKQQPCTLVTLGVGGDIDAETAMKYRQTHCQLYGADPINESGKIYANIGKYFELAVSDRSGYYVANVLETGKYVQRNVSAVSFVEFIQNHVRESGIDYLFMDNEGPEYKILPQFFNGGSLERNNIVVCQISLEMHGPLEVYGMNETKYLELLTSILENSPLLPLRAESINPHERAFLINIKDTYCADKYIGNAFDHLVF